MITLFRRFLVIAALMFWQGGFVFYAAIVVPVGTEVLGGSTEQGFITRHVARKLNWAGAIALLPIVWDACTTDPRSWRRLLRVLFVVVMLVALVMLFWLHPRMDELLSEANGEKFIEQYESFDRMHRVYLWTITTQFAAAVGYVLLSPAAWRAQDRSKPASGVA